MSATWLNVAFTFAGLRALGASLAEAGRFPPEFRDGMVARASVLGDVGPSAPARWPAALRTRSHALIIVGADRSSDRDAAISRQKQLAAKHGVKVLWVQNGDVRVEQPGPSTSATATGSLSPVFVGTRRCRILPIRITASPARISCGRVSS